MKYFLTVSLCLLPFVPAFAHPGTHDEITGWALATEHFLGSPFHVLLVVAAAGAGFAGLVVKRSRAIRTKRARD